MKEFDPRELNLVEHRVRAMIGVLANQSLLGLQKLSKADMIFDEALHIDEQYGNPLMLHAVEAVTRESALHENSVFTLDDHILQTTDFGVMVAVGGEDLPETYIAAYCDGTDVDSGYMAVGGVDGVREDPTHAFQSGEEDTDARIRDLLASCMYGDIVAKSMLRIGIPSVLSFKGVASELTQKFFSVPTTHFYTSPQDGSKRILTSTLLKGTQLSTN